MSLMSYWCHKCHWCHSWLWCHGCHWCHWCHRCHTLVTDFTNVTDVILMSLRSYWCHRCHTHVTVVTNVTDDTDVIDVKLMSLMSHMCHWWHFYPHLHTQCHRVVPTLSRCLKSTHLTATNLDIYIKGMSHVTLQDKRTTANLFDAAAAAAVPQTTWHRQYKPRPLVQYI